VYAKIRPIGSPTAPPESTAFARRSAPLLLAIEANWQTPEDDEANVTWSRRVNDDMRRCSPGCAYLNVPGFGEEGESLLQQLYGHNFRRMQDIQVPLRSGQLLVPQFEYPDCSMNGGGTMVSIWHRVW
jgi:hypothetical protein